MPVASRFAGGGGVGGTRQRPFVLGGGAGRGNARLTWNGAAVKNALDDVMQEAMQTRAELMEAFAQEIVHVITHLLQKSITATVDARGASGRRTIVLEASAPYAAYEFARGGEHAAFMTASIDFHAPLLTQDLRRAAQARGF